MKLYGLTSIIQDITQWVFNNADEEPLVPNGQWDQFLPVDEVQTIKGYDPYSCTVYGTQNCIETILRAKYGLTEDYSERFTAIVANILYPGTDPHTTAEAIRTFGLIDEVDLPCSEALTVEEYYRPKPVTDNMLYTANLWKEKYKFNHYWVFNDHEDIETKISKIKKALVYSPIGVSVHAWQHDSDTGVYYKDPGTRDNHWCMLYGYNEDGTWKVFDSLDLTHKTLVREYGFTYAKMYSINPPTHKSLLTKLFDILKKWLKY